MVELARGAQPSIFFYLNGGCFCPCRCLVLGREPLEEFRGDLVEEAPPADRCPLLDVPVDRPEDKMASFSLLPLKF